jgi:hypothetical protein
MAFSVTVFSFSASSLGFDLGHGWNILFTAIFAIRAFCFGSRSNLILALGLGKRSHLMALCGIKSRCVFNVECFSLSHEKCGCESNYGYLHIGSISERFRKINYKIWIIEGFK